jgi:DNA-binding FrmR family transcriptional regulator
MAHLKSHPDLTARVRRISGQLAAVERALAADADCAAVLQQIAAVRGAVNGLMDEVLAAHLRQHVAAPGLSDEARGRGAEEVLAALRRYGK